MALYSHLNILVRPAQALVFTCSFSQVAYSPSESSLIIRHVLLATESLFFFLEYDVWEKDYHCSEVLWSWETRRMLITEITEALTFFC